MVIANLFDWFLIESLLSFGFWKVNGINIIIMHDVICISHGSYILDFEFSVSKPWWLFTV